MACTAMHLLTNASFPSLIFSLDKKTHAWVRKQLFLQWPELVWSLNKIVASKTAATLPRNPSLLITPWSALLYKIILKKVKPQWAGLCGHLHQSNHIEGGGTAALSAHYHLLSGIGSSLILQTGFSCYCVWAGRLDYSLTLPTAMIVIVSLRSLWILSKEA